MTQLPAVDHISVTIERDWREVYAFAHQPAHFAQWASGLASTLRREAGAWFADTPTGPARIEFSPPNAFGVLDHTVIIPGQAESYNPLRVVANGNGAEVIFTLFRRPDHSDDGFAHDVAWVRRDLTALKTLLESTNQRQATNSREQTMTAEHDRRIDYIEFVVSDIARAKAFYGDAFGWRFTDYGPDYTAFADGRLDGGFEAGTPTPTGGPLVILYATDLAATQAAVEAAGGQIKRATFAFPGGRRFHFLDPDGYELAVWSDQ